MRRLLVTLVVLLGLLAVADRVGAAVASRAIAAQVESSARAQSADVDVAGFPFLTQALAGRYDSVQVSASRVPAADLTVDRLDVTLTSVEVPLGDALSGSVSRVPVSGVEAQALIGYAELSRRSGERRLTVVPAGDRVRVTGSVRVLGQTVSAVAVSRVEVVEGSVIVTAESFEVGGVTAEGRVGRALGRRLDLRIPVTGLPYGLRVTGVAVQPDGVRVAATAGPTVLGALATG